jgi:hypothetical protein
MTATIKRGAARTAALLGASAMLGGCVQVAAPDRPIEVNLNINIRQEVVVRLQQDARELIQREQRDY